MQLETILSIVGTFGTIALTINAFFLRAIFDDLNAVKLSIAKMYERGNAKERRIMELESNQKEIYTRLNALERNV